MAKFQSLQTYCADFHHEESLCAKMEYRQLGETDMHVSYLGLGASAFGSVFRNTDDQEVCEVTKSLLKSGINYIDTAPWYGHGKSEQVLGKALKHIPREAYYMATKVGRYNPAPSEMFDFGYERTLASVDESLERLGLEYVDLIQVHDVEFANSLDIVLNETLPALQKVKDQGKARYIGITGYPLGELKEIVERSKVKIDTVLTYCRYSMNDTTLLEYNEYFKSKGVGIINASPISMGLLTTRGPPDWHPAKLYRPAVTEACSQAAAFCESRGVNISRLALHFSLQLESCATCLVSTASKGNAKRNLEVVDHPLTDMERQVLDEVMKKYMVPLGNAHWEGFEVEALRRGDPVG